MDTIFDAFANDEDVRSNIFSCAFDTTSVLGLLTLLCNYCKASGLKLYAFFDQHNGIPLDLQTKFPFSLLNSFSAFPAWRESGATVVVSASANNEGFSRIALKEDWPILYINHGFSEKEAVYFLHSRKFYQPETGQPDVEV